MLQAVDYTCDHDKILLDALTKVCKDKNDRACDRLPIKRSLLEQILFETERRYSEVEQQPYFVDFN